jgi:hypothetical protein
MRIVEMISRTIYKIQNERMIEIISFIVIIAATVSLTTSIISTQLSFAVSLADGSVRVVKAPMAVSGDNNLYVTWWSNKTGDWEIMFKASNDAGKTFGEKIDLSNTKGSISDAAEIEAEGKNVYVSWWEHNDPSTTNDNQPVMRISNDNGKTFGPIIMLSSNATSGS